ncbi:unnamed protein product [Rotaria sp. Silwood1]|nr:unnamed protein product [Rotaria sp. Silwood1]
MSDHPIHRVSLDGQICVEPSCTSKARHRCKHCHKAYCDMCVRVHKRYVLQEMSDIAKQMEMNRQQSQIEVRSFIERQRADARAKAEAMQRDIIRRINEANQNVLQYMDDRAQMKLSRLTDALNTFDNDSSELKTSLSAEQFLSAKRIIELRTKYASNMFDDRQNNDDNDEESNSNLITTNEQPEWEKSFFSNGDKYRMYDELINLRAKWPFLAPALTSIYYAAEKDFSLDDIRTFLEYRHDKVLNLFNEHCKAIGKGPLHATAEDLSFYRYKSSIAMNQVNDANFDRCLHNASTHDEHNHYHHELTNTMSESMRFNIFSLLTFIRDRIRYTVIGVYLIIFSICGIIMMILFLTNIIIAIEYDNYLVHLWACHGYPYLFLVIINISILITAVIAIESVLNRYFSIDRFRSRKCTLFVLCGLFILVLILNLDKIFARHLKRDQSSLLFCAYEYPLQQFWFYMNNSTFYFYIFIPSTKTKMVSKTTYLYR